MNLNELRQENQNIFFTKCYSVKKTKNVHYQSLGLKTILYLTLKM